VVSKLSGARRSCPCVARAFWEAKPGVHVDRARSAGAAVPAAPAAERVPPAQVGAYPGGSRLPVLLSSQTHDRQALRRADCPVRADARARLRRNNETVFTHSHTQAKYMKTARNPRQARFVQEK